MRRLCVVVATVILTVIVTAPAAVAAKPTPPSGTTDLTLYVSRNTYNYTFSWAGVDTAARATLVGKQSPRTYEITPMSADPSGSDGYVYVSGLWNPCPPGFTGTIHFQVTGRLYDAAGRELKALTKTRTDTSQCGGQPPAFMQLGVTAGYPTIGLIYDMWVGPVGENTVDADGSDFNVTFTVDGITTAVPIVSMSGSPPGISPPGQQIPVTLQSAPPAGAVVTVTAKKGADHNTVAGGNGTFQLVGDTISAVAS